MPPTPSPPTSASANISLQLEVERLESQAADIVGYLPTLIVILVAGVAIDLVRSRLVARVARSRGWKAAEVSANALSGLPTLLAITLVVAMALERLGLDSRTLQVVLSLLKALVVLIVTAKLAILAGALIRLFTRREDTPISSSSIFVNLGRVVVWTLGLLTMLAALDVSITPLLTALGVAGLAVGLALQPTLENLFSGVQVLASRQVEIGDFVRLQTGEEGWIQDVTWRNTTLRTVSNDLVIAPNAAIGRSLVVNFTSHDEEHSIAIPLGVAYDADLTLADQVVREVALETQREAEHAIRDHEPSVHFTAFTDTRIDMIAVLRTDHYTNRFKVRSYFIKRLHERFAEEGLEIPHVRHAVLPPEGSAAQDGSRLQ